ncbi:hypothetical protein [Flavobacterium noncentrifugens]|uniref:Uncharacterized protein n=1 Tax=Flavobacterium noncentrifugens TaxID=1128970 RepID=A0A1G9DF81_9FLAO|nr:hypothetical protein [Flavobacterium noncentrifugens]SDK62510.1 hypothetical protein SAMN04487935_3799 [Flavobacterium noncentrifugens]
MKNSSHKIVIAIAIILLDLLVYLFLGIMLMAYDDFYDPSKGSYGSWESMTSFDKTIQILLYIWNFINILTLIFVGYKFYKKRYGI